MSEHTFRPLATTGYGVVCELCGRKKMAHETDLSALLNQVSDQRKESTIMTSIEEATRAWAKGIYPVEAGVELLIRHGKAIYEKAPWLEVAESLGADRPRMAAVNVDQLLEHTGAWSGSERRIVRIAASLINGTPVDLNEDLPGLDRKNLARVLAAIAHANGSHEHSEFAHDDKGAPDGFRRLPSLYPWSSTLSPQAHPPHTITEPDAGTPRPVSR